MMRSMPPLRLRIARFRQARIHHHRCADSQDQGHCARAEHRECIWGSARTAMPGSAARERAESCPGKHVAPACCRVQVAEPVQGHSGRRWHRRFWPAPSERLPATGHEVENASSGSEQRSPTATALESNPRRGEADCQNIRENDYF